MKSLKKWLVVLPLAALLAACNNNNGGDPTDQSKKSALPAGGELKEVLVTKDTAVREKFADDVEAFVINVLGSDTFELESKASGSISANLDKLEFPYNSKQIEVKAGVSLSDLNAESKIGVSFKDSKLEGYANAMGSGKLGLSYELPDELYSEIPEEYRTKYGIAQKNSDSFTATDVGVDAYIKDGKAYVNGDKEANRTFAKSVLNTKLVKVGDLLKDFAHIEDASKFLDDLSLKYVFDGVPTQGPSTEVWPSVKVGDIAPYIKQFLTLVNEPAEKDKELVDMVLDIISTLSLKTYVYSADSDYSYAFSAGVDSMEQLDNVYAKIISYIPDRPQGIPLSISSFLSEYGVTVSKFSFHINLAFGVGGKAFLGMDEDIKVSMDNSAKPIKTQGGNVVIKAGYELSSDSGIEFTASKKGIPANKFPSAEELATYEEFSLPFGGAKNGADGVTGE